MAAEVMSAVRREMNYSRGEPKLAVLFMTYRCTSRCRTCKMWLLQWDLKRELTPNEWLRVADVLTDEGVEVFELFGGDVFLRRDALFPLIMRLKEKKAAVHIPTNSRLLDDETAQMLVDSGVDYLYLSTDGVEATHDKVRGIKDSFALVQRAINALVKCRGEQKLPRLICNTTVSKFNVDSLEKIAQYAYDAGFDEIDFEYVGEMTKEDVAESAINGFRPTPYFFRDGESVLVSPAQAVLLKKKLKTITSKYSSPSFRVGVSNIECLTEDQLIDGGVPKHKCYTERCEVSVDPGGSVVACPFFHSYKYGNLLETDFNEIWWSQKHKNFHRHLSEKGLSMCRHCIPSVQRSQSFSDRLERIYKARVQAAQRRLEKKLVRV
jgi:MoaA/NifB/PqqE/SkfB family radical SAM enzyme